MEIITSPQNPLIKHLAKLTQSASYRREEKTLLLEGKKLIEEWLVKGSIKNLFVKEGLPTIKEHTPTFLKKDLCSKISSLKTNDGYFAEVTPPLESSLSCCNTLLVIDKLQDPGNLGTLIRSALAFSFDGIFILEHSVDPYSPKVIRSSMGAALHIPMMRGDHAKLNAFIESQKLNVYIADAAGQSIQQLEIKKPFALILGNEASGSSLKGSPSFHKISIPIQNIDSLNVAIAGSLLMLQMRDAL